MAVNLVGPILPVLMSRGEQIRLLLGFEMNPDLYFLVSQTRRPRAAWHIPLAAAVMDGR